MQGIVEFESMRYLSNMIECNHELNGASTLRHRKVLYDWKYLQSLTSIENILPKRCSSSLTGWNGRKTIRF